MLMALCGEFGLFCFILGCWLRHCSWWIGCGECCDHFWTGISQTGQGVSFHRSQKTHLQLVDASGHIGVLLYVLWV
jgi:hypothetical protein